MINTKHIISIAKRGKSCLFIILVCLMHPLFARQITDMAGRQVSVPDRISRVIPYDNKTNVILYSVAGSLMLAKARTMESPSLRNISKSFLQLREVDTRNAEEVLKLKPDVIIVAAFVTD